jgi:hypothetical protein
MQRRRIKHEISLKERIADQICRLKDEAEKLPQGNEREEMIRRARQAETASHLTEWLNSPGLARPK